MLNTYFQGRLLNVDRFVNLVPKSLAPLFVICIYLPQLPNHMLRGCACVQNVYIHQYVCHVFFSEKVSSAAPIYCRAFSVSDYNVSVYS